VTATVTRDPSTQLDDDFRDSLAHTRAFVRNVVVPREQEIDEADATLDSGDWWTRAACRDAELAVFFSPDDERGHARDRRETQARQICRPCPVLAQCRDHALVVGETYGVWGGMTEGDRRKHSRRLRRGSVDRSNPCTREPLPTFLVRTLVGRRGVAPPSDATRTWKVRSRNRDHSRPAAVVRAQFVRV
jgi:hypothetical protein